jgi:hypothetical protein
MPRPKLNPTEEQRRLVKKLAAVGTKHEDIAHMVNIRSPKTLRKHFREELDRGAAEANASVAGALYKKAMDGDTNAQKLSFGIDGTVDLKVDAISGTGTPIDLESGEIGVQSAPVVAKDTVIVGSAFREGGTPKTMNNTKGLVRGFDVRTGKRLWIFRTIPQKGEFGYDTWLDGSAEHTGNRTMDAALGR